MKYHVEKDKTQFIQGDQGRLSEGKNFIPRPEGWEATSHRTWGLWRVGVQGARGENISGQWEYQGQRSQWDGQTLCV